MIPEHVRIITTDHSVRKQEDLMNKVGASIKKLRRDKGINQNQLADQLHVTRQAVSNWETGVSHS